MERMDRVDQFIKLVTDFTHIPIEIVRSKTRKREICEARQLLSFFLRSFTELSFNKIAYEAGLISHATVMHNCKQVSMFFEIDKEWKLKYRLLYEDAKNLAARFKKEDEAPETIPLIPGTVCWFWNECMPFPVLGTLRSFRLRSNNEICFRSNEEPIRDYHCCKFAGERIVPREFIKPTDGTLMDNGEDMNLFYEESLIEPVHACIL
jgi:hypothetical protein